LFIGGNRWSSDIAAARGVVATCLPRAVQLQPVCRTCKKVLLHRKASHFKDTHRCIKFDSFAGLNPAATTLHVQGCVAMERAGMGSTASSASGHRFSRLLMRAMKGTRGEPGASSARKSGSGHGSIHDVSCGATGARLNVRPALGARMALACCAPVCPESSRN
jgi:hypothetical protein